MLVKVGDFQGAAQCYRDALKLAPTDLANVRNLQEVLLKLSVKEPDQYAQELAAVQAIHKKLEQDGARLPSAAQW